MTVIPNNIAIQCLAIAVMVACSSGVLAQENKPTSEQLEFFERKVRPLLADNCYSCHSSTAKKNQASLLLDSRAGILNGGDSGAAVEPGNPGDSLLISAVEYEDYEMPPKGKLADEQIAVLKKWVKMGAPWPEEKAAAAGTDLDTFDLEKQRKEHWVWQPVEQPPIPEVEPAANSDRWSNHPIDQFIFSKLNSQQLKPAEQAEPLAIARRLHMDLIGLPPTDDELIAFENELASGRTKAIENLVDRLLASPHFGERWGRHWLDLTRFAESYGHEFDTDIPNAFQYRDYVIRALNADVPYDQFVREHIAGDLLDKPRLHPEKKFNESMLGTGFWFLGESAHSPVDIRKDESDRFDNMIDVTTKSFLGVTVSCARCHDHKFDAISTADYYSLTGFLQSSDYRQVRFESHEANKKVAAQLADVNKQYDSKILELLDQKGTKLPGQTTAYLNDDRIIFDFATLPQSDYLQDGFIFGDRPVRAGRPYFRTDGSQPTLKIATHCAAANDPIWNGLESITEGKQFDRNKLSEIRRSGRTLRTPTFELKNGNVSCLVSGKGHVIACVDSHRLVYGPLHKQTIKAFDGGEQQNWVELDLKRYIGHRLHLEFVPAEDRQISVRLAAQGLDKKSRQQLTEELQSLDQQYVEFATQADPLINVAKPAQRIVFEDFEQGYGEWVVEGDAFGASPQTLKTIGHYQGKINCVDRFFVNSHNIRNVQEDVKKKKVAMGDSLTGTLTSPEFSIEYDSIEFLIGGGAHKGKTCVNLLVDGKVVRTATGRNKNQMFPHSWDVAQLRDKRAVIQVVDSVTKGWGNIGIDHIVFVSADDVDRGEESRNGKSDPELARLIENWKSERAQLSAQIITRSRLAPAMLDGTGEDAHIYIRGNAAKFGKLEPRHFLTAIDGAEQPMEIPRGSGRLQLAAKINDPNNPLTSRVIVNRIWHHLMGRGLVPTTDDFGVLGQLPTHPELLDHLAGEFVADGRSIKQMIKRMVLTQTYQMSARPVQQSLEADPKNTFWHHRPPRRLQGEAIRDSLLAISGALDKTQEGPSVRVHLTKFMEGRGRPKKNGPLDGDGRRSIYVSVRRNFIAPFMTVFDTPVPFSTMGRRNVSNVPAQALILMNDPFVSEQAKKWAARSLSVKSDPKERVQWLYRSAFSRNPTESEMDASLEFVEDGDDIETWSQFAHALINTKEFIFLR